MSNPLKFSELKRNISYQSVIDDRLDEIEEAIAANVSHFAIYTQLCVEGWEGKSFITFKSTLQKSRVKRAASLKLNKKGSK